MVVIDERKAGGYPTPVSDAAGKDAVFVGRIREDISHAHGLNMWIVSDNIRKGAALNAVQIGELFVAVVSVSGATNCRNFRRKLLRKTHWSFIVACR